MKAFKSVKVLGLILMALSLTACPETRTGPAGPPGPASVGGGGRIVSTYNCSGTISGLGGGAAVLNGLDVEYDAVLTGAGDVYATASVIDEVEQTSGTMFYAAGQSGAATASVFVTADYAGVANGGLWTISMDRNTLITSIQYTDSSLGVQSPVNLVFTAIACTVQNW